MLKPGHWVLHSSAHHDLLCFFVQDPNRLQFYMINNKRPATILKNCETSNSGFTFQRFFLYHLSLVYIYMIHNDHSFLCTFQSGGRTGLDFLANSFIYSVGITCLSLFSVYKRVKHSQANRGPSKYNFLYQKLRCQMFGLCDEGEKLVLSCYHTRHFLG